jgi:hypothetical protein
MKTFDEYIADWFAASKKVLGKRKDLEEELIKREFLVDNAEEQKDYFINTVNVCGTYNIVGGNPDQDEGYYSGILSLDLENNQIFATWLIEGNQKQTGYGFIFNNTLIINFSYVVDEYLFRGIVAYQFLTPDVVIGKWTEEVAESNTFEMGRRLSPNELGEPNPEDYFSVN